MAYLDRVVPPGRRAAVTPLARLINDEILKSGPIPVSRFMELALGHPDYGYYRNRAPLGAEGDFITAPEVSQMFGEIIGLWAVVVWEALGTPDPFTLAELGPGRGTLMTDALRATNIRPGFAEAAQLHLVETGPQLRAHQARVLADFNPTFHDTVTGLPTGPMIVIANEFFDALPVRQWVRAATGWAERHVDIRPDSDGGFMFTDLPAREEPDVPTGLTEDLLEGSVVERAPIRSEITAGIASRLTKAPGAVLIIDYGHGVTAAGDSLQAVQGHQFADPLMDPGTADLTAHVDFAALAQAAGAAGAEIHGPVAQGQFLLALGLAQRAEHLKADATAQQRDAIDAALKRLIAPSEMGNLFKVMGLTSPHSGTLPGFAP
jgi:NADH dehydrogenase [ubiquinone] 1 alpha subcomplex assembly factor 7